MHALHQLSGPSNKSCRAPYSLMPIRRITKLSLLCTGAGGQTTITHCSCEDFVLEASSIYATRFSNARPLGAVAHCGCGSAVLTVYVALNLPDAEGCVCMSWLPRSSYANCCMHWLSWL